MWLPCITGVLLAGLSLENLNQCLRQNNSLNGIRKKVGGLRKLKIFLISFSQLASIPKLNRFIRIAIHDNC